MPWFVYVLQSTKSGRYYVGCSDNIERRLEEHNKGKNKSTRSKGPWVLVHAEEYKSRIDARKREYKIKSYKGGNAFKKLIGV